MRKIWNSYKPFLKTGLWATLSPESNWQWWAGVAVYPGESEPWMVKWGSLLFSAGLWSPSGGPDHQWGVQARPQATICIDSTQLTAAGRRSGRGLQPFRIHPNLAWTLEKQRNDVTAMKVYFFPSFWLFLFSFQKLLSTLHTHVKMKQYRLSSSKTWTK